MLIEHSLLKPPFWQYIGKQKRREARHLCYAHFYSWTWVCNSTCLCLSLMNSKTQWNSNTAQRYNQSNSSEIVSPLLCATREDNTYTYDFCVTVLQIQYWFHYYIKILKQYTQSYFSFYSLLMFPFFSEMLNNWHLHDHFKISAHSSNRRQGQLQARLLSKTHFSRATIPHFTEHLF